MEAKCHWRFQGKLFAAGIIFSAVVFARATAPLIGVPRVQAIRFWSFGDVTRVAIQMDGRYKLKFDRIEHPYRLYFDLNGMRPPTTVHHGMQIIQVSDQRVKQIRVAQVSPGTTRVVFDLQSFMEVTSSQLVNPERLIVEIKPKPDPVAIAALRHTLPQLSDRNANSSAATSAAVATPLTKATATGEAKVANPKPGTGAGSEAGQTSNSLAKASRLEYPVPGVKPVLDASVNRSRAPIPRPNIQVAGSPVIEQVNNSNDPSLRSSESTVVPNPVISGLSSKDHATDRSLVRLLGLKLGRVVIDAGHGGHDTGTIGPNGLLEKDLVLDIALRLGALISGQMGTDVVYTRSSDVFIPLEDRTKIANDQKADLFISIHANSSPETSATGVETYYFNLTSDRSGLNLATRENATATSSISDLNDLLHRAVLQTKLEESREFAQAVQAPLWNMSLRMNPQSRNRGVRQAPFVVLIGATMPSILAEVGFVSNGHDERLLRNTDQRQKIAESLYKGISNYASALSHTQQQIARSTK